MKTVAYSIASVFLALLLHPSPTFAKEKPVAVAIPAGIQHEVWDGLLKKYVNEKGLIAYEKWKANTSDRKALDEYLAQFAPAGTPAKGDDLAASGINAYNAFAVQWIIQNYPTESIWSLPKSFDRKALKIGGQMVSLNDIENGTLRPALGYRVHATIVCCARSCPPLQRNAYTAAGLQRQIDAAYTTWLSREDLNHYSPEKNSVEISSIFKWFKEDFDKAGGVPKVLGQYGPPSKSAFLSKGGYKIDYLPYRWGLNDQGGRGENYSKTNLILDHLF
jgi:uncharacterized protein DUF547